MSLLEDIYAQDDVQMGEEDLERIIEGGDDEPEENRDSENDNDGQSHSEAEEEKPRKVNPEGEKKAKVVRNPRFVLNPARLMGPRGISTIENFFSEFKFRGKGYEKDDLDVVMKKLEHWAHRLYPKFQFDDCLDKIASLGNKKIIQAHMRKIRLNMIQNNDDGIVKQVDSDNEEGPGSVPAMDEFDMLLEQQIALARSTPATNIKNTSFNNLSMSTIHKPNSNMNTSVISVTSPIQTPSAPVASFPQLTEEQKARMMKNRLLAEERRLARMKANMGTKTAETNVVVNQTEANVDNTDKVMTADDRTEVNVTTNSAKAKSFTNQIEQTVTENKMKGCIVIDKPDANIDTDNITSIELQNDSTNVNHSLSINDESEMGSTATNHVIDDNSQTKIVNNERFDEAIDDFDNLVTEIDEVTKNNNTTLKDNNPTLNTEANGQGATSIDEDMMDVDDITLNLSD